MNPLEGLGQYLDRLERRLKVVAWTRGAAAIAGVALVLTLGIVAALMAAAFTPSSLLLGRFVLFLGIGAAAALALIVPLLRMNRRAAAQEGEQKFPGFDQRLLTFTEKLRDNSADPFLPLLAADALEVARGAQPEQVIDNGRIVRFASVATVAAGILVWLLFWGPGVLGTGAALLWGSYPKTAGGKALYTITVEPGSKTIRRKSDQMVSAELNGFLAPSASIWARYASSAKWEQASMQPQPNGPGYSFPFIGVPEDVDYYVEAGGVKSATYKLRVVDLPAVKNIRVTYTYPSWTGLKSETEDPGGDLRAVEGTIAKVEIQTDRPLSGAQLLIDGGKPLDLPATQDNKTTASVEIEKDGAYHIGVMDHGEVVRLTDDYFIEARKVSAPTVRITKPGRDAKVSPIEEVDVQVSAEDEYPLQALELHYSVNGAAEKTVSLLNEKGVKKIDAAKTMLSMEDFKLVPGDIVSIYATAKDGKNTTKTDMFFIQAVPFEFNYTQSQQSGGGGGGQGMEQEQQISEREKEIIAATFNQIKGDSKKLSAAENGKYLAEVQSKLREQATSMANRTKARQLDANGAAFQQFVKEMEAAVAAMGPASDKLKALSFQDALTPEQQALQHLLRAESTFRDIQIQISRGGGGGGGGGGGAGRDLANLFDLELDKEKNQYESSGGGSSAEQQQQKVDDAMKKLADLARRQQELAQQQQNNPQQVAQQRWQQEMLRREAEQLKRDMEDMKKGDQNGQQGQQSAQNSGSQGQQGQQGQQSGQQGQQNSRQQAQSGGQQGGQSGNPQSAQQQSGQQQSGQQQMARNNPMSRGQQQQLDNAIRELDQATRDMSSSASARQPGQQGQQAGAAQSEAQKAAERLKQAQQMVQAMRNAQTGSEMNDVANKAEKLADQQQDFEQRLRRNFGQGQENDQAARQMADEKKQMHAAYDQLQKEMQAASRDMANTQPDVSKKLRDAMGQSQQDEVGNRMDFTEQALRQGMAQYAVMREAPVTRSLNELKDEMKQLQAAAAGNGQGAGDDKSKLAMQQALDNAEKVRRDIEQLSRAAQAGNRPGGRQGQLGQGQGQQASGRQGGNQPGQQGQGQQQGQQSAQGGQQGQGQSQGQGQGQSPQGSPGNQGGGNGRNPAGGPRGGSPNGPGYNAGGQLIGPGWQGDGRRLDQPNTGDLQTGPVNPSPAQSEAAYGELMRDLARLRGAVADDKDAAKEYGELVKQAQQLDPKRWATNGQLTDTINAQMANAIDEVELLIRRKLDANDGSVRSPNPRNTPPGYANAVAEYYKRLSKQ
jgi:hypothetical protein